MPARIIAATVKEMDIRAYLILSLRLSSQIARVHQRRIRARATADRFGNGDAERYKVGLVWENALRITARLRMQ
jgi:hypothetical protein